MPTFVSAATSQDGTKVVLTYNEALSATIAPTSAFTVTSGLQGNDVNTVSEAVVSGSTVELTVSNNIKNDETVKIAGFGTYKVAKRKARVGRNPRTGESIQIAASQKVKFLPAKSLKEMFNK